MVLVLMLVLVLVMAVVLMLVLLLRVLLRLLLLLRLLHILGAFGREGRYRTWAMIGNFYCIEGGGEWRKLTTILTFRHRNCHIPLTLCIPMTFGIRRLGMSYMYHGIGISN